MRLPRESLLFLGLLTALGALVGVVFGIYSGAFIKPDALRATATAPATASSLSVQALVTATPPSVAPLASPSPTGAQKSLLVIGVDDAQSATPQLLGVWVISFRPGINTYYLLSVPPSAEFLLASLSGPQAMSAIFAEDQRQQIGFRFVRDAIQSRFPGFTIQADVVLDRDDFAGLVAQVGGLTWAGELLPGPSLLLVYDSYPPEDSAGRLLFQQQLFQALFDTLGQQGVTPAALIDYVRQLPQVQADADRQAVLDAFVAGAPDLPDSDLNWQPYLPEMEISAQP